MSEKCMPNTCAGQCQGMNNRPDCVHFFDDEKGGKMNKTEGEWRKEFQYLLDRKILSRDELGYLFGQIKSTIEQENQTLLTSLEKEKKKYNQLYSVMNEENAKVAEYLNLPGDGRLYSEQVIEAFKKEKEGADHLRIQLDEATYYNQAEKERADKLESELNHVDMVLARRDALDNIPDRIGKILHAIKSAKQAEKRLEDERVSVNALSLANQELEKKVKGLERKRG